MLKKFLKNVFIFTFIALSLKTGNIYASEKSEELVVDEYKNTEIGNYNYNKNSIHNNDSKINKVYDLKWKTSFSGENYYEFDFNFFNKGVLYMNVSKDLTHTGGDSKDSDLFPNTISIFDEFGNKLFNEKVVNGNLKFDEYKQLTFDLPKPGKYHIRINAGVQWKPLFGGEAYWNQTIEFNQSNENFTINNFRADWTNHWASENIQLAMDKDWVVKTEKFRPEDSITRAEFVKIFNRAFKITKTSGKIFNDTKNHWAKNEVDIAVTNGVCNGVSTTQFSPDEPITREQAAKMICNYKKISDRNLDKLNKFKDFRNVSSWAKNEVEGVLEQGYMKGYEDNTFRPLNNITRAEAISTLIRIK